MAWSYSLLLSTLSVFFVSLCSILSSWLPFYSCSAVDQLPTDWFTLQQQVYMGFVLCKKAMLVLSMLWLLDVYSLGIGFDVGDSTI